jgi:MoaA/NifB/PqqE/SkfB family radical SAM enzyme
MSKFIKLEDVVKFEIELSSYCNARCPLCIRQIRGTDKERKDFVKGHLTINQIKKLISELPDSKRVIFYFGGIGGDPMMNPDIVEIFKYCSKNLKSVLMDTNASLQSTKTWKELGKISQNYGTSVTFSIDGLEDTNHIYRIRTNWKKIINNAKAFISNGGNATWKYIVFKHNQHQVEAAKKLSNELGFKKFTYENSVRHYKDAGPLQPEPPTNVEKNKIKTFAANVPVTEICCKAKELKMLYISSDFSLYPCCYFHSWHSYEKDTVENYMNMDNNLNNRTLKSIINDNFFTNKLVNDWNDYNPMPCAKSCNQVKYWERRIEKVKNE